VAFGNFDSYKVSVLAAAENLGKHLHHSKASPEMLLTLGPRKNSLQPRGPHHTHNVVISMFWTVSCTRVMGVSHASSSLHDVSRRIRNRTPWKTSHYRG
jgi:hypothetical protein